MVELTKETLHKMVRELLLVRGFEEKVNEMFQLGKIGGTTHLGIGQEACAVGAINAIDKDDYIISYHRGHGHTLVKGASLKRMMAELFGKSDGFCQGMGGSMHIVDVSTRNLGSNGIVGGGFPIGAGVALALKKRNLPHILVNFFGEGSTNEGSFHEAINLASIWKLPILFICENNLYGMSTPVSKVMTVKDVAQRAFAYEIPAAVIDGNDVLTVYEAVKEATERVRSGEGPIFLELKTYRWTGHSKSDPRVYRTRVEENEWKEKCPIKRFKEYLIGKSLLNQSDYDQIKKAVEQEIDEAVEYAEECPYTTLEKINELLYA